jgi:hypothetical protein
VLDKTAELERRIAELELQVRGVQQATQGWDGEILTVRDLILTGGEWDNVPLHAPSAWIAYGAPYNTLRCKVMFGKIVLIMGTLKLGNIADGTTVGVVPSSARPLINQPITLACSQGGAGSNDPHAVIDPGGSVVIFGVTNNAYLHIFGTYVLD